MAIKIGIVVLCGLPASGKSSLCSQLICLGSISFVHVCYDELLPWISSGKNHQTWKKARSNIVDMVKHYIQCVSARRFEKYKDKLGLKLEGCTKLENDVTLSQLSSKPTIFLIDDNMQYRGMRYEYYQLAKEACCGYSILFVDCPMPTCIERNNSRPLDKQVQYKSFVAMNSQLEVPGTGSAWENQVLCIVTSEKVCLPETIADFLQETLHNPLSPTPNTVDLELSESCREINRRNINHQADILLRKQSKQLIQSSVFLGNLTKQCKSKLISEAKGQILEELKAGLYDVDAFVKVDGTIDLSALEDKLQALLKAYLDSLQM